MNQRDLDVNTSEVLDNCYCILTAGSHEYAGDEDKLANFKDCGKLLDIPPEKVAFIYFYKHVAGIAKYCRDGKIQRDPIRGRITDAINYLILLDAIFTESAKQQAEYSKLADSDDLVFGQHSNRSERESNLSGSVTDNSLRRKEGSVIAGAGRVQPGFKQG